ncbi:hypothetical protein Vadar_000943 [Vaccinium darrowii]|uniref:Uncharacterized protein n=1 Tax=Vaccinium darrowii TaxID=229202 RepID=A0ACB7YSL8_9ERIC|nr:hypothetical protein Vadar_000943 [Vaccinium darrowii]
MNEREDVGRRLKKACLSGSVSALVKLIEEDELILDRVSSLTGFFNDTPLHIAALRGHLDFMKALLTWKPKLATELDSLRCSPLHLASAEGHVEIVKELLRVNTNVCIARDQDGVAMVLWRLAVAIESIVVVAERGFNRPVAVERHGRIPLHLAVIKERVDVIPELLRAEPESIYEKLGRGETVLHLCVKYNRLEALKTLVQYLQSNDKEFLLNYGDNDGNTILHLSSALKQMDIIEYLLGIKSVKDQANVKNQNGSTALDVVESVGGGWAKPEPPPVNPRPSQHRCKAGVILQCIYRFWRKYFKVDHVWLQEVRGHLITAATLTATVAYEAVLSPPGGFWQESGGGFKVGQAVLDTYHSRYYAGYLVINTGMLLASLSTIMLALSGFPNHNKFLIWMLVYTMYITLSCMVVAYVLAIKLVAPEAKDDFKFSLEISVGLELCWMGICGFVLLLHAFHFFVWLWNKFSKLVWLRNMFVNLGKTCHRSGRGPRATRNVTTELVNPAGSHMCMGSFC